jgi:hypothetical protein
MTFKIIAYSSQISMKFRFIRRMNDRSPMFSAENDVDVILYE